MFLEQVINEPICEPIAERYRFWYEFMQENIEFNLLDSTIHTKEHCARVLLMALIIANKIGLSDKEMDVLSMAAVFHDSCRINDWIDRGHGKRASEYYKDYCYKNNISFDIQTYYIIHYHDQNDDIGLLEIGKDPDINEICILLYQIFKDADALDRFRLGPNALNIDMIRTKEACKLIDFARYILKKSNEK